MLSNVKACQSETVSQRFTSHNSPLYCTLGCLFTKGSLLILASSRFYIHTKGSDWMI